MGVAGSAAAGRLDVRAGRMKVPASQRGVIALNGAGDTSTRAVPAVSTERGAMTPAAPPPCAASASDPDQPNLIRTRGVVRRLPPGESSKALESSTGTATGEMVAILLKTPLSAGTSAPVTIDGYYVIARAGEQLAKSQHALIIACKLGAAGKLPDTVAP